MLTGCRREEIGGLQWAEVLADHLVICAERMKAGSEHEVPLLPDIATALPIKPESATGNVFGRRGTGFSGWSKSKTALDLRIAAVGTKVPPWRLHDLRRTLSTRLHDAGVEPIVIEALGAQAAGRGRCLQSSVFSRRQKDRARKMAPPVARYLRAGPSGSVHYYKVTFDLCLNCFRSTFANYLAIFSF
jgi:Phage integrase family